MSKTTLAVIGIIIIIIGVGLFMRHRGIVQQNAETTTPAVADVATPTTESISLPESKPEKKMYTQATFKTNMGDIVIAFDTANTPKTVENFTKLSSQGFYDGTKFHRVIKDFMIQGGDPLSKDDAKQSMWGTGGPGYQFDDEIKPTNSNAKGTISMANAGPNTNGSQFFINVADNGFLNGKHTVFGRVTQGYDLVEKISMTKTGTNDRPVEAVVIKSIELK